VLARSLDAWRTMLPDGAVLAVVDDASDPPARGADFRFAENAGIARTKNKGLELLADAGCTDYFLADDDCWPISPDWWRPYVASPVPHLQYLWNGRIKEQRDGWVAKNTFHGCLLYIRKNVIDRVGGMRPEFGKFGYEHVGYSRRIHAAGLTPHRYIDVVDSTRLWLSLDQQSRAGGPVHASSMGPDRKAIAAANLPLLERFTGSTDYVEYREAVRASGPGVAGSRDR
jgi:hypothetical protein